MLRTSEGVISRYEDLKKGLATVLRGGISLPAFESRVDLLMTATLVFAGLFTSLIVALHFLRSDLNPVSRTTSEYAVGSYGFVMTAAFICMIVMSLALVTLLAAELPAEDQSRTGVWLLGIWIIGAILAAIFPIDPEGPGDTTAGTIHRIAATVGFLSFSVGALLISRAFGRVASWQQFHRYARALAVAMLVGYVIMMVMLITEAGYAGLVQRILLVTIVAWMVLVVWRIGSEKRDAGAERYP